MAEAVVEENPIAINRFFCHKCGVDIPRVLDDFTCPTCLGGFIEELEESSSVQDNGTESSDEDMNDISPLELLNQVGELLFGLASERGHHGNHERERVLRALSGTQVQPTTRRGRNSQSRPRGDAVDVLQDFIVNLAGVGWGPVGSGRSANGPVFFLGNPGDYAWGREGLDAIVTQLLNQMEVAGPPPLDKEKIKEIPMAVITQEQADSNLQCSVCWDDFESGESVRKLECDHLFHDQCIVPWLKLHGTCPICRKTLSAENEEKPPTGNNGVNNSGFPDFSSLYRRWGPPSPSSSSSSSLTMTSTSSSDSNRMNQSDNPMDFDFD